MNYCPNCGSEQENNAAYCSNCGSEIHKEAPKQEPFESASSAAESTRFLNTRITIRIGIGLVILIFLSYFGFNYFLNKNPKELYLLSELNTTQNEEKTFENSFADEIALQKKLLTSPATTKTEFEADVTSSGSIQTAGFELFQDILKDSKFKLLSVQDPKKQLGQYTLSYMLDGTNLFEAYLTQDKENTGLEVPAFYDKMLYIKNDEFGDFMKEKNPDYTGPDKLTMQQYKELFSLTDKQQERLKKGYKKFFVDNLQDEYFTLTKNVSYSIPDGEKELRQIDIKMTEEQFQQFILVFIDQVQADKELQKIAAQKFVDFMYISRRYQAFSEDLVDVDYVQEQIEDGLDDFKEEVKEIEFPDGFHMTVMIDGNEQIVDRKINFEFESDSMNDGLAFQFHSSQWDARDQKQSGNIDLKLSSTEGPKNEITFKSETLNTTDKKGEKKDIKAKLSLIEDGEQTFNGKLDFTILLTGKQDGKAKTDYEFDLLLDGGELAEVQPQIKGKIKQTVEQNLEKNYSNQEYQMELGMSMNDPFYDSRQEISISLDLSNDVKFSDKIKIPSIGENALDVTEMTDSDWYELQTQLTESADEFLLNHEELFNKYYY